MSHIHKYEVSFEREAHLASNISMFLTRLFYIASLMIFVYIEHDQDRKGELIGVFVSGG